MKPSTVDMLRAWLLIASLAATFIDAVVLFSFGLLGVPERMFETRAFHLGVLAVVVLTVIVTRVLARSAYRTALASRHAIISDTPCQTVSVSADCPLRLLVIFHLRLNRAQLASSAH
jgi:hypothetical protein